MNSRRPGPAPRGVAGGCGSLGMAMAGSGMLGGKAKAAAQGAQMAQQAGLTPQQAMQGAKMAQQAGVKPSQALAAGKLGAKMMGK